MIGHDRGKMSQGSFVESSHRYARTPMDRSAIQPAKRGRASMHAGRYAADGS
jgi:hypothetical protein